MSTAKSMFVLNKRTQNLGQKVLDYHDQFYNKAKRALKDILPETTK